MKTHNAWPTRRFDLLNRDAIDTRPVKNGCTGQGRFPGQPEPAECGTSVGADDGKSASLRCTVRDWIKTSSLTLGSVAVGVVVYAVLKLAQAVMGPQQ